MSAEKRRGDGKKGDKREGLEGKEGGEAAIRMYHKAVPSAAKEENDAKQGRRRKRGGRDLRKLCWSSLVLKGSSRCNQKSK